MEVSDALVKGMLSIIDVCSKRGAYEGSELESIGQIRSQLVALLQSESEETLLAKLSEETKVDNGENNE